jgi:hypothetical protein
MGITLTEFSKKQRPPLGGLCFCSLKVFRLGKKAPSQSLGFAFLFGFFAFLASFLGGLFLGRSFCFGVSGCFGRRDCWGGIHSRGNSRGRRGSGSGCLGHGGGSQQAAQKCGDGLDHAKPLEKSKQ